MESERSRDVYAAACEFIAEALLEQGFRYTKSNSRCTRRSADFTFEVGFSTSSGNISGSHVVFSISGGVRSPKLAKWRSAQVTPMGFRDALGGGNIGNLRQPERFLRWELADPSRRDEELNIALTAVMEIALPYFAIFDDQSGLVEQLLNWELPAIHADCVIEFLLFSQGVETASAAVSNFLRNRDDLLDKYHACLSQFRVKGLPRFCMGGYAQDLAYATLNYNLTPVIAK